LPGRVVVSAERLLALERRVASSSVERVYGLASAELELERDPALDFMNPGRGQVEALRLVEALQGEAGPGAYRIHITSMDIYFDGYNFCFGLASGWAGVVSTNRLRHRDVGVYLARLRKEVIHEVGHILGLRHCSYPRCVMFFSSTVGDTDLKGEEPCPRCRLKLG